MKKSDKIKNENTFSDEELKVDKSEEIENSKEEQEENTEECINENKSEENVKDDSEEEELNTRYLRLMADFQNYKRRTEENRHQVYQRAIEDVISELLPILDNLERAVNMDQENSEVKAHQEGTLMILDQLKSILEAKGLEEIKALGEEFNPSEHNAVMMEDSEEFESNMVTCVLQKGYRVKGKVIRPAMVKVAN